MQPDYNMQDILQQHLLPMLNKQKNTKAPTKLPKPKRKRAAPPKLDLESVILKYTPQEVLEEFCRLYPDITVVVEYPIL